MLQLVTTPVARTIPSVLLEGSRALSTATVIDPNHTVKSPSRGD